MSDPFEWSCRLLKAFYENGVRRIYLSPGSRSTPLVLAAASHPGFQKKIVLDERSAAFRALGSARATGRPALLVCTSGTAAANYHPAVIEARHSGAPLILLTADRPPGLRGTGSSQTIDQIKLFGDSVLFFHETGEPSGEETDLRRLDLLARQSVEAGGPVHLNMPFRKPFEPATEALRRAEKEFRRQTDEHGHSEETRLPGDAFETGVSDREKTGAGTSEGGFVTARSEPDSGNGNASGERPGQAGDARNKPAAPGFGLRRLPAGAESLLAAARRPLLVAGPEQRREGAARLLRLIAEHLRLPVIAEPGTPLPSGLKTIRRYDMLLRGSETDGSLRPDLVIRTGTLPWSAALQRFGTLTRDLPAIQFLQQDIRQQAGVRIDHRIVLRDEEPLLPGPAASGTEFRDTWHRAEEAAEAELRRSLQECDALTDGHVCRLLASELSSAWDLMLSNSFTIRDYALFRPSENEGPRLFVNRGAAGIDGIVSTAAGISDANNRRTAVLVGDLAFLHDSNALLSLAGRENGQPPPVVVVLNNGGGTIFRMLPVRQHAPDYFTDYFETPQRCDISSLAAAHGLDYVRVASKGDLDRLRDTLQSAERTTVVECITDPDRTMELRESLWSAH